MSTCSSRIVPVVFTAMCILLLETSAGAAEAYVVYGSANVMKHWDLATGTGSTISQAGSVGALSADPANDRIYWYSKGSTWHEVYYHDHAAGLNSLVYEWNDTSNAYSTGHMDVDPVLNRLAIQVDDRRSPSTTFTRYTTIQNRDLTTGSGSTVYQESRHYIHHYQGYYNPSPVWYPYRQVEDVVIDPVSKQIYWADSVNGWIRRMNMDGSGVTTLHSGLMSPTHLELDVGARQIYFTDMGDGSTDPVIQRVNMDGSGTPANVYTISTTVSVTDLAIDPLHQQIYWCEYNSANWQGVLHRVNYDGSGSQSVQDAGGTDINARLVVLNHSLGAVPDNPMQGSVVGSAQQFVALSLPAAGVRNFFSSDYAPGLDCQVSGSQFSSILLPDTGDGQYALYAWTSNGWSFLDDVLAGEVYTFSAGVSRFLIDGLETGYDLNPQDPGQFIAGLTFTDSGSADMTITTVPEPATLGLLALGGLAMLHRRHRD